MRKHPLPFLIISIIIVITLIVLIIFVSPDVQLSTLNSQLSILYGFFVLFFLFLFFLSTYIFKSKKHGILIASFTVIYLMFRLNDLTHPFFFILLAALFLTVELLVSYRK